jgi:hypothetical protein
VDTDASARAVAAGRGCGSGKCAGSSWEIGSDAVLEAPAFIAGLDDVAVVGEPIEERGRHFRVAEHARPFAEGQVGRHDHGRALVEPADQMEQQLAAGLGEWQIAEFVEDDEVESGQIVGKASLPASTSLGLEPVDEMRSPTLASTLASTIETLPWLDGTWARRSALTL